MGFDNSCGGSSNKTQKDCDESKTSVIERPLRKARFAWQVKGKYHLKSKDVPTFNENAPSDVSEKKKVVGNLNDYDACAADTSNGGSSSIRYSCDNLGISNCENSAKQGVGKFTSAKGQTPLDIGASNSSTFNNTNLQLTKAIRGTTHINSFSVDTKEKRPIPVSMVKRKSKKHAMLAKWQAKQIATAFVDNTINGVLDSWVAAPLSSSARLEHDVGFHAEEFLDTLPRRYSVENEGILMAISKHGLRHNCEESASTWVENGSGYSTLFGGAESLSSPTSSPLHPVPDERININYSCNPVYPPECGDIFCKEKSCSDTKTETNSILSNRKHNMLYPNSRQAEPKAWQDLAEPCLCSHSLRSGLAVNRVRTVIPFHKRQRATTEVDHLTEIETNSLHINTAERKSSSWSTKKIKTVKNEVKNEKSIASESEFRDVDFMDAALVCAIQDKGLGSIRFD